MRWATHRNNVNVSKYMKIDLKIIKYHYLPLKEEVPTPRDNMEACK